jgi:thioredoxin reductase
MQLVELFEEQAKKISIAITRERVVNLTHDGQLFQVVTDTDNHPSRIVVIASGTKPKTFNDIQVPSALHEKVLYEVHPLLHLKGMHITIVGAGDAAFDYALNLGRKNQVTILNRGERIKCLPLLWERVGVSPNLRYLQKTKIIELSETPNIGMSLTCKNPEGMFKINTNYLIGAIGRKAQLDYVPSQILDSFHNLENQGILYQIGDVCNGIYRQTSIAAGQGILTAMKIYHLVREQPI